MNREIFVDVVERLPQAVLSRAWGWLARRRHPKVGVEALKRVFVMATGIDMSESRESLGSFETLEELFVRELRSGLRRVEPDPTAVISPVDGSVGASGRVEQGLMLQVKGRSYSLSRLLGDADAARDYENGSYMTLYLSPKDYHRVHAPVSGVVSRAAVIPGRLMPVFPEALDKVDELFARNERLITYLDSADAGRIAVVMVGATLVGRMTVAYDSEICTNVKRQDRRDFHYESPHLIQKGGEVGMFELGSTVVLVGEKGRVAFDELLPGRSVRMGQRIGTIRSRRHKSSSVDRSGSEKAKS